MAKTESTVKHCTLRLDRTNEEHAKRIKFLEERSTQTVLYEALTLYMQRYEAFMNIGTELPEVKEEKPSNPVEKPKGSRLKGLG